MLGEPFGEHVSHRLTRLEAVKQLETGTPHCSGTWWFRGHVLSISSEYNRNDKVHGREDELTRYFGMSASTGFTRWPSTMLISRMQSEQ